MFKKIFASVLIIFYILCLPLYSYSSTLTYNKFMKLTSSGAAKVAAVSPVIARGLWAAGAYKIIPYAGMVIAVGMMVYDAYKKIKELTVVNVPVPASAIPVPPLILYPSETPSGTYGQWGEVVGAGIDKFVYTYLNSDGTSVVHCYPSGLDLHGATWSLYRSALIPAGNYECGGYTVISSWTCYGIVTKASEFVHVYYKPLPALPPLPDGVPTADLNPGGWPSENWPDDPLAVREGVERELAAARAIAEAALAASPENEPFHRFLLTKIIAAQDALKSISLGPTDYTTTGVAPVENTYPLDVEVPSFPSETPPVEDVPPISDNACFEYQRKKHFDYSSLLQSAQAVPLLGLLSKLVINPVAGQFDGKVTFQLSKFGTQEIDLNKWHYSDAIAIFRFVIIGGAFLTAIRIIYD